MIKFRKNIPLMPYTVVLHLNGVVFLFLTFMHFEKKTIILIFFIWQIVYQILYLFFHKYVILHILRSIKIKKNALTEPNFFLGYGKDCYSSIDFANISFNVTLSSLIFSPEFGINYALACYGLGILGYILNFGKYLFIEEISKISYSSGMKVFKHEEKKQLFPFLIATLFFLFISALFFKSHLFSPYPPLCIAIASSILGLFHVYKDICICEIGVHEPIRVTSMSGLIDFFVIGIKKHHRMIKKLIIVFYIFCLFLYISLVIFVSSMIMQSYSEL
jgi:hypothetical protein